MIKIQTAIKAIEDAFYPKHCPICDRTIKGDMLICPKCKGGIVVIKGLTCDKCGKPLADDTEAYCYDCRKMPKMYDRGYAVFEYKYIKDSLYRFKYSSRAEYAAFYAAKTVEELGKVLEVMKPEAFIPVPVHRSRYLKRGYNQAKEYAGELSRLTGIPVNDRLVIRAKRTKAMKELTPFERQKNLKKAFKLTSFGVELRRVCVVDDIYTTGSTVNTIAQLLKGAGIQEIYFVSIAIGQGF